MILIRLGHAVYALGVYLTFALIFVGYASVLAGGNGWPLALSLFAWPLGYAIRYILTGRKRVW